MYKIIGVDGKEYGPVDAEGLRRWIAEGRANAQTRVRLEGAAEWRFLRELPEFAAALPGGAAPGLAPGPIGAPLGAQLPRTNSLAVAGLLLGIASVTFAACCCGGFPFNLAGLICSGMALSQINKDPLNQQGKGLAVAGLVLSLLSVVVWLLALAFGLAFDLSGWRRRVQEL